MNELKKQAEAVLFAAGDKIEVGEIARLCRADINSLKKSLKELKKDYDEKDSSLMISEEGNFWKLAVREAYMDLVQQINPHTELSKTTIETLAVIAWKAPILQSDVIKARTNKAYDHIKELVDSGFLIKQRHGRSYMLKLSQKFFEYFDLKNKKDIKERFKDFADINEEELKKLEEVRLKKEEEAEKAKEEAEENPKQTEEQDEKEENELEELSEQKTEEKPQEKAENIKTERTEEKQEESEETKEETEQVEKEEEIKTKKTEEQEEITKKETKEQKGLAEKEQEVKEEEKYEKEKELKETTEQETKEQPKESKK